MKLPPFITHPPGNQDPETFRQFNELQRTLTAVAEDYTYWAGNYDGGCYPKGAIVVDGNWTMVAKTDTCDRPAPTPIGDPFYVYTGSSPTTTLTAKSLTVGNIYTFPRGGFMNGFRVYTVTGNVYMVWYQVAGGPVQQVAIFTASTTGWLEQTLDQVPVPSGTEFTLAVVVQEPDPSPTVFTLSYDYQTPQNPLAPTAGVISHSRGTATQMDIHKTDQNGDQSSQLAGLSVGDTIDGAGIRWAINSITDNGTYYSFGVAPAANGTPLGVQDFTFETTTAVPITTVVDTDYFLNSDTVQPFYEIDGSGTTLSDDGYGVDILLQEADVSPDWELMSYSGGGAGGGSDDFVQKTGDTMSGALRIAVTDNHSQLFIGPSVANVSQYGFTSAIALPSEADGTDRWALKSNRVDGEYVLALGDASAVRWAGGQWLNGDWYVTKGFRTAEAIECGGTLNFYNGNDILYQGSTRFQLNADNTYIFGADNANGGLFLRPNGTTTNNISLWLQQASNGARIGISDGYVTGTNWAFNITWGSSTNLYLTANGTVNHKGLNNISDAKFKRNIQTGTRDGLEALMELQLKHFDMQVAGDVYEPDYGLVAQDLKGKKAERYLQVNPNPDTGENDLAVSVSQIIWDLVDAVQVLNKRVKELEDGMGG